MSPEDVDVEVLWELLHEDGGRFSVAELAEVALGTRSDEAVRAVGQALAGDRLHFRDRKGLYEPRPAASVDEALRQRRLKEERAARREANMAAVKVALATGAELDWALHGEVLRPVEELAIHGDNTPAVAREAAEEMLRGLARTRGGPWRAAVRTLTSLGRFSEDENLLLLRHRVPQVFGQGALDELSDVCASVTLPGDESREDRTGALTIAIDDDDTDEVDDALSAEELPQGGWRVEVHIADPGAWIRPDGAIDLEARRRGATLYLPDRRIPMLPEALAYDVASLSEGRRRRALTFRIDLDAQGGVRAFEPLTTFIEVDHQLRYEEVDSLLEARSDTRLARSLRALFRLADLLRKARLDAGALEVQPPEVKVKIDGAGQVRVTPLERFSASRKLVSEWMIQCGRLAAAWCSERDVPMVYRRQDAPDDPPELPPDSVVDAVAFHGIVRKLRKATVSSTPGSHWGLGVAAYTQVTSPIRRYADLVMHRQIKAALEGDVAPDSIDGVLAAIGAAEQAAEVVTRIERATHRYYVLKHLSERIGATYEAVVVAKRDPGRWRISVDDLAVQTTVALRGSPTPRDVRTVEVVASSPRQDQLQLRELGQSAGVSESGG